MRRSPAVIARTRASAVPSAVPPVARSVARSVGSLLRPSLLGGALLGGALLACGGPDTAGAGRPTEEASGGAVLLDEVVEKRFLGDVDLLVREIGSGDPLLVVHGGPGMEHSYLIPGLEVLQNDARLVFYDQRGTGRSGGVIEPDAITLETFLADIDGVRASVGFDRVDLMGHSFGGLLALLYAARYPDHVRSLVLVASVEPGGRFRALMAERQNASRTPEDAAALEELMASEAVNRRDSAAMSELYWTSFRTTFADRSRADRLRVAFTSRTAENGGQVAAFLMTPLGDYDFWSEVEGIQAPTLVVHGEADPIPVELAKALSEAIEESNLVVIPDAGHFPFLEQPEAFREAVREFLDGVRRGGSQ